MKIRDLCSTMRDRVPFRRSEEMRVPDAPGCYVMTNITDDVIYIGQSKDLNQRIGQHLDDRRMTGKTSLGLVSWFYFGYWPSDDHSVVEDGLLFKYRAAHGHWPPLNRTGP